MSAETWTYKKYARLSGISAEEPQKNQLQAWASYLITNVALWAVNTDCIQAPYIVFFKMQFTKAFFPQTGINRVASFAKETEYNVHVLHID